MSALILRLFLITIVLFFVRIKYGLCLLILLTMLVPTLPNGLHWSYVNISLFIAFLVYAKKKEIPLIDDSFFPFLFFYLALLVIIPFSSGAPMDYQISTWIGNVLRFLILPMVMFQVFSHDNGKFKLILISVYLCIFVATIYAFFLTQMDGINPYLLLLEVENVENGEWDEWASDDTRVFGRIFSVFNHPMTFGCFIVNAFFFCLYKTLSANKMKIVPIIGLLFLSICAVICGVRSVMAGIAAGMIPFMFYNFKRKYFIYGGIFFAVVLVFALQNETLLSYFTSIFSSSDKAELYGSSSYSGRLSQLMGCFNIMMDNPFFGKGFGWTALYNEVFGSHPECRSFESYIFVILCNWGLAGVIFWVLFLIRLFKQHLIAYEVGEDPYRILICLSTAHIAYICITGDYVYTIFWAFFYLLILLDMRITNTSTQADELESENEICSETQDSIEENMDVIK